MNQRAKAIRLLRDTVQAWHTDSVPRLAAALTFYLLLSLAPLFIVAVSIASFILDRPDARGRLIEQIDVVIGPAGEQLAATLLRSAYDAYDISTGIIASVIGTLILFFSASLVFNELRSAFDSIWNVAPKHRRRAHRFVRNRLVAFGMVLGTGLLLLCSLVGQTALTTLKDRLSRSSSVSFTLLGALDFVVNIVVLTLLFAVLYRLLPQAKVRWKDVGLGAGVAGLLFVFGRSLIGLYLGNSALRSVYGAAGSLVVFLVWTYYSTQIFLLGAELSKVYSIIYEGRGWMWSRKARTEEKTEGPT
ncbi:MAG: YihY/virulence factor BrkB family protein [Trueperaceae bacterium]|nr:MAG: YihY/virulence factor BrkB family protein [Trueperaceae bacterium]